MAGPIRVDLEEAEQCKAIDMIRFLFALCLSSGSQDDDLVCSDTPLGLAFEKVKLIAKCTDTILATELSNL